MAADHRRCISHWTPSNGKPLLKKISGNHFPSTVHAHLKCDGSNPPPPPIQNHEHPPRERDTILVDIRTTLVPTLHYMIPLSSIIIKPFGSRDQIRFLNATHVLNKIRPSPLPRCSYITTSGKNALDPVLTWSDVMVCAAHNINSTDSCLNFNKRISNT